MSIITLAADSTTLILNGTPITTFAEGDYLILTPVNALTSHVNSARGGVNIAKRLDGSVYDLTVRVQKYGIDDVLFTSWINSDEPTIISGSVKEVFFRDDQEYAESWTLEAGTITTLPTSTANNQDGSAMLEYVMRFRRAKRSL